MKNTMLLIVGALALAPLSAQSAIIFSENFDSIPDGDLSADSNWTAFSGADGSVDVTSGVVTGLGSDAEDVSRGFSETSGVYFGIDINVSDDASSDYIMGFRDGTGQAARFFLSGDGSEIALGVNSAGTGSSSAGATSTSTFSLNTDVRIVGYADGNGTVSAWINPGLADSAMPDVTFTNADVGALDGFFLRQGGSWDNGGASWTADNLVVATTFDEVIAVPEPSSFVLLGLAGLAGLVRRRR
ncbi:PEP-CTERM sorting domain-containing protein [Verrucomicrobiaceae bacterium 5K15]|uniref:PEP-CTERM sorting domain-containing protein n=1 Tax=Oceaniferula flava TaxID=2800421 RepID=A0AAE2SBL5_9BACT|nr:PEP-CTERM sorting domain-containing protein [Oceaniferula flavus]MBK1853495.1 PEP-CTERM sorting domain-containing protein [Oceaniferula flavus]MBM1134800.1 PEP-CTERM sorting domain-containing protein [Oceaniferula flavus]